MKNEILKDKIIEILKDKMNTGWIAIDVYQNINGILDFVKEWNTSEDKDLTVFEIHFMVLEGIKFLNENYTFIGTLSADYWYDSSYWTEEEFLDEEVKLIHCMSDQEYKDKIFKLERRVTELEEEKKVVKEAFFKR